MKYKCNHFHALTLYINHTASVKNENISQNISKNAKYQAKVLLGSMYWYIILVEEEFVWMNLSEIKVRAQ